MLRTNLRFRYKKYLIFFIVEWSRGRENYRTSYSGKFQMMSQMFLKTPSELKAITD